MTTLEEILTAAQGLPSTERAKFIQALWDSTPPEDWTPPGAAWVEEAQRRSTEFDEGRITASPWPEVRQRARRKAGLDD